MKKRWISSLITVLLLCFLWMPQIKGQEKISFQLSTIQEVAPGDKISVLFSAFGGGETNLATFRVKLSFDQERLELRGIQPAGETESGDFRTNFQEDGGIVIFLSQSGGITLNNSEKTELFILNFTVKQQASDGETTIQAQLDGIGSRSLAAIPSETAADTTIKVVTPDYSLQALQPDQGVLTPEFTPTCFQYRMQVPYSVDRLTFYAQAYNPDAVVKVSRQTLEKAGTSTLIKITVRSQDGTIHSTYQVEVYRQTKASVQAQISSSASQKKPAIVGGKISSSSKGKLNQEESIASETQMPTSSQTESAPKSQQQERSELMVKGNSISLFLLVLIICTLGVFTAIMVIKHLKKRKSSRVPTEQQED